MSNDWRNDFEVVWHDTPPLGVDEIVRRDILKELTGLKVPSNLVTHTVFLSDDMDGPCVSVWGEGDDRFHAEYLEKAEWVTLSELDNGTETKY